MKYVKVFCMAIITSIFLIFALISCSNTNETKVAELNEKALTDRESAREKTIFDIATNYKERK
jgi:hypothetical protein